MLELNSTHRKNKINLEDYDYQSDIHNRLLLSKLDEAQLEVLEEILFGPPKQSLERLSKDLNMSVEELTDVLTAFETTKLFQIKDDSIILNKELRKYFEAQIAKFDPSFIPGMEYLQSLLKKVPYHVLLSWYPIPRTSNNIFDSIIEKYLYTPQTFQRYLMELNFGHDAANGIVEDVFNSPSLSVTADELKKKYDLSDLEFEELMLHLEFNFVCCLVYQKEGSNWIEVVTPFYEWKNYLKFLKESKPLSIETPEDVVYFRQSEFAFIEDLTTLLNMCKQNPIPLVLDNNENWICDPSSVNKIKSKLNEDEFGSEEEFNTYLTSLINKLLFLKIAKVSESSLVLADDADDWLAFSIENRALANYKQTLSKLSNEDFSIELATERNVREIEKSLHSVIHSGWVYFDEFLKCCMAPISEESKIALKKQGRSWVYSLPSYNEEEVRLIEKTVLEWLFEFGLVSIGTCNGKKCFSVTSFGQSILS